MSSCAPSQQHATLAKTRWKSHAGGCRASDAHRGGCEAEQLCLPTAPGNGFEAAYCIWQAGELDCPAATFTRRRLYHRELEDTRSCSDCTCVAPSCSYKWRVFNLDDTSCASPVLELSSVDQCAQINPVMGKLRVGAMTTGGGACSASGGESRGAVTASKPVTVCCSD